MSWSTLSWRIEVVASSVTVPLPDADGGLKMLHALNVGVIDGVFENPFPSDKVSKYSRQSSETVEGSRKKSEYKASTNSRLTLFGSFVSPMYKGYRVPSPKPQPAFALSLTDLDSPAIYKVGS